LATSSNICENCGEINRMLKNVLYGALKNKNYNAALKALQLKAYRCGTTPKNTLTSPPISFRQEWQNQYKY
jgi:hypothetical protein